MEKSKLKEEAIARLEMLQKQGLLKNVVKDFKEKDLRYYSLQSPLGGMLYWLNDLGGGEEYQKAVEEFEEKNNCLVYHAIVTRFEFGTCLSMLFVSEYEEEWEMEREDLKEGIAFGYVKNLDDEWCSEFGSFAYAVASGGLIRRS